MTLNMLFFYELRIFEIKFFLAITIYAYKYARMTCFKTNAYAF